jgi:competence protein ComEC
VLLGVVCGSLVTGARVMTRDAGPLAALTAEGATVTVDAVLRDDPRAVRGSPGRPPTWLVAVQLSEVRGAGPQNRITLSVRALILGGDASWQGLLPGQRITAEGRLLTPRGGDLSAAVLSVTAAPVRHGDPGWAQTAAGVLRAGLQRACAGLPREAGGLLPGLVVGDVSRLDPAVDDDFRATGMTHLTAVSGANVG